MGDKDGRCAGLESLPSSCADRLETWETHCCGILSACPGLYGDRFTFLLTYRSRSLSTIQSYDVWTATLISDCIVGVVNALPAGKRGMVVRLPSRSDVFLFNKAPGLALGPTLPPVQLVLEPCSPVRDSG